MNENGGKLLGIYDEITTFLTQINLYKSKGHTDSHDVYNCIMAILGQGKLVGFVLLKALLPVCMKYTARDESPVANIARGEAVFVTRLSSRAVYFHTNEVAVF